MKSISAAELKGTLDRGERVTLIDVREPFEREIADIGGSLIPVAEVESRLNELPRDGMVVVYCRSGARSAKVIRQLELAHGYLNLCNLEGGVLAWADEVDPSVKKY